MFERANYSWNDPLSAQSFQAWRNQLTDKRDEVSEEQQDYRIETRTDSSDLRHATLTLRTADLRPVEEHLEFSNQEWVEITEVGDDSAPSLSAIAAEKNERPPAGKVKPPVAEVPQAVTAPASQASAGEELQVVAALHEVGADLGDPVEVSRSGTDVLVSGVGIAPARQEEIKNAIGSNAHVVVHFSDSPAAAAPAQPAAPNPTPTGGDVRQLQTRLAEQLGGRANLDQLAAQVLDSSESLMARAYALRRLAEQFPVAVERELSVSDRQLLQRMRGEHSAALRQQATGIARDLQPVLSTVNPATVNGDAGTAPDKGIPLEPWQAATENLFQSARRLDKLLGVMFGAAPSEIPPWQISAQLKTSLAQLRAASDSYERSNK
jgi:hypothetical protein